MNGQLSLGRLWMLLGLIACCAGTIAWSASNGWAQAAAAEATDETAEEGDATEGETAASADAAIEIPDGDAAEIAAFIEKLAQSEPEGDTPELQIAHAIKVLTAIRDAAGKMLGAKPNDEQTLMAERYKLMALQGLSQLGAEEDAKAYADAVEKAMNDPRPEIAAAGWQGFLYSKLAMWDSLDEAGKQELNDKILAKVKRDKLSSIDVSIVAMVAQQLDRTDDPFVAKLLTETLPIFQKSDSDEVKQVLVDANLEGMLRRLTLLGQPMEVSGDLLGGGKIDWKKYRGKVVLVDFSATWCGPCVEEAPNVLNMYNLYKDKGFDVVAVSLDRTPEAAEQYVKENGIKWATLFPAKEEDRYWNNPLAKYYGVSGIPTAILVDQKGNAVHMNARGPLLQAELERLLGAPGKE